MSKFPTTFIQAIWFAALEKDFLKDESTSILELEFHWIRNTFPPDLSHKSSRKSLPFRSLNMAKCLKGKPGSTDEFFLDQDNNPLSSKQLLESNLNGIHIKTFHDESDIAKDYKQAKYACSIADFYMLTESLEVVIELEDFKDKPFSNLIYLPEACQKRDRPLLFLHVFAPLRRDLEAELTRKVGRFLAEEPSVDQLQYVAIDMPELPEAISYLLPEKKARNKERRFREDEHQVMFQEYLLAFFNDQISPVIRSYQKQSHAQKEPS